MIKVTSFAVCLCIAGGLAAAGCGEEERSFDSHWLYCKVAGYYVLPSTPEEERAKLMVGVFGLTDGGGEWILVSASHVEKHPDDATIDVAKVNLDQEPDDRITTRKSTLGKIFYLLELRAWLDENNDGKYQPSERFVDGLLADRANQLLKDAYRAPFVIPNEV